MSRPVRQEDCKSTNTIHPSASSSSILNAPAVTIIGDTGHTYVYAYRLLRKGYTGEISILVEGTNYMNEEEIQRTNFVVRQNSNMLKYLKAERIYIQRSGDGGRLYSDEDPSCFDGDLTLDYQVGSGVIGDLIASYIVPRVGPWFDPTSKEQLTSFVNNHTMRNCLTPAEAIIVDRLINDYDINPTNEFIVNVPSISTQTTTFVKREGGKYLWRNLFEKIYDEVMSAGNVNLYTNVTNLQFAPGSVDGTYHLTFSACEGNVDINNNVVVWKTNPYTFLRLSTMGGLDPATMRIPTTYRAVVSIPQNNVRTGGIDVENADHLGDLVTSINTFCMNEISKKGGSCKPEWLCQAYTSREDTSQINGNTLYASEGRTLLIIELISLRNRRKAIYDTSRNMCCVTMNRRSAETYHLRQVAKIVASIYTAATGLAIDPSTIIGPQSVCQVGICSENFRITSYVRRETSLNVVCELLNHLYGGRGYPVAGDCF